MHEHPASVEYFFTDAKAKFTLASGKSETRELKADTIVWGEAEKHASENTGTTEGHVLIFELKGGKSGKTEKGADAVKVDSKHFKVRLNNARVRVLEFTAKPHEKVPMHSHPDYVTYNFTSGKTKFSSSDGKTGERESAAGSATWRPSETHVAEMGNSETHNLLIELKP
jgi:quercetin dioxygenase-like cupin family protein